MGKIIGIALLGIVCAACFLISFFQWREKGPVFNNAYLYAGEETRREMNKKPYYRQSAVVFLLMGIAFGVCAAEVALTSGWLFYAAAAVTLGMVVYVIVSSVKINQKR
ncbi:MAG: DUF3784 domain-containing protein [Eubacteriales bacterium]|mgnify:FL=1|nr:DUF3784 domain-containing protein [Eubacteriales bacterium]MDY2827007.1 DUF3784 domain-containing protein [Eubacteriales bacterium]